MEITSMLWQFPWQPFLLHNVTTAYVRVVMHNVPHDPLTKLHHKSHSVLLNSTQEKKQEHVSGPRHIKRALHMQAFYPRHYW